MIFTAQSYRVLLISASDSFCPRLKSYLPISVEYHITEARTGAHGRRLFHEQAFDMVIINMPLRDEPGTDFAWFAAESKQAAVLLFAVQPLPDELQTECAEHGVFLLPKPCPAALAVQAFYWMNAMVERLRRLQKKTATLEDRMAEIRLMNRAKWLLIEHLSLSEEEAHHYLERYAMDRSITKKAAAEAIVSQYSGG